MSKGPIGKVAKAIRKHVNRMIDKNQLHQMNVPDYTTRLKKLYLNGGMKIIEGEIQLVKKDAKVKAKY